MPPTAHPDRRLTYDDFLLFPEDDGLRHEIRHQTSSPTFSSSPATRRKS